VHTGLKHREVYKTRRSSDAKHRTVRCSPVLKPREHCKMDLTPDTYHRTHRPASGAYRPVPYPSMAKQCLHRTLRLSVRCSRRQHPVSDSRDLSKVPTGTIENMHFIFSKSAEPILSLPFKLHLLLKVCQHHKV